MELIVKQPPLSVGVDHVPAAARIAERGSRVFLGFRPQRNLPIRARFPLHKLRVVGAHGHGRIRRVGDFQRRGVGNRAVGGADGLDGDAVDCREAVCAERFAPLVADLADGETVDPHGARFVRTRPTEARHDCFALAIGIVIDRDVAAVAVPFAVVGDGDIRRRGGIGRGDGAVFIALAETIPEPRARRTACRFCRERDLPHFARLRGGGGERGVKNVDLLIADTHFRPFMQKRGVRAYLHPLQMHL